ncbi:hypothetical protein LTR10_021974 [Elasticomyces elasticus]|uniref:Nitroreductase n=1 Tax=Exophiala sideris TaxID=1016849 RepID=A0ABR0JDC8_9EURO|nr:hypothetical protein LTR10_021974 [Elasticomyces elasticus]KAK5030661.1 putative nitroreductase [Exophiala sideris]KAK5038715.1 hypothetical protein LTR13_004462 [Exophiala sideris]KAK5060596.1 putative nitroreductase [Exophiala sideris]KAK5183508.1 putative nitroreductase [Eurotiomycetes sp. CCFEE 6388]
MAADAGSFLEAAKTRRSIYQLAAKSPISDSRVLEIVREALLYCPSTFNTQTTRTVVIFGEEHVKLWDIIINIVQPSMAADVWNGFGKARFEGFRSAYGTVLFFEVKGGVEKVISSYGKTEADKAKIQTWQDVTNGMHQYYIWTQLSNEGLGCNLQHCNPHVDDNVASAFDIQKEWELKAQLVFGTPTGQPKNE